MSEESRPPSNAAVNFRRAAVGKAKVIGISCVMAGVAPASDAHKMVSTPHSLCCFNPLRYTRQLNFQLQPNKMG